MGNNSAKHNSERSTLESIDEVLVNAIAKTKLTLDDFETISFIGRGCFGKVYQVRYKKSGMIYAMKVLKKKLIKAQDQVNNTKTERKVLETVSHPFIVTLRYAFQSAENLYLITDFYNGGELFFHLKRLRRFPESYIRFYASEIVLAIESLHKAGFVYRDLKAENLLLDEEGHVKMTDFGLAKEGADSSEGARTTCGTPSYMAPEMLQGAEYGQAVDWWALGTLMYELATGQPPFYHRNRIFMFKKILNEEPVFHDFLSDDFKSFLSGLLAKDEKQRLNAEQIKSHPFFSSVNWNDVLSKSVQPPFKPSVLSQDDLSQFEVSDLQMSPIEANSPVLEGSIGNFSNFSYNPDSSPYEVSDKLVLEYSPVY